MIKYLRLEVYKRKKMKNKLNIQQNRIFNIQTINKKKNIQKSRKMNIQIIHKMNIYLIKNNPWPIKIKRQITNNINKI